jgi:hypothetical protein
MVVTAILVGCALIALPAGQAKADPCVTGGNPITCENSKPGTPRADWDVSYGEGTTIQGFADPFSVNLGGTINFKIESNATSYGLDIYRMGYYGGDGARLITSLTPSISVSQNQPACNTNTATGLVDCSNWKVSASWTVPTSLVSGVYFAHIYRTDGSSDENQIPFVVRSDSSHSDILFGTDDETWEAYNDWGGYSLYTGDATDTLNRPTNLDAGRAEQVSYDRPFATRWDTPAGQDYFFYAEFPTIEYLEENGYNVSYIDQGTVASPQGPSLIEQHKVFMKAGHDEYWTAQEVNNVTAARNAGVNLAFFTGNEVYWKTRFAADAAGEAGRTLTTYKESLDSAETDPAGPTMWTGSWMDPRFSPPGDGGVPQNSLTGQLWTVNAGTGAITVPAAYSKLQVWRNTAVASLQPGQTATLSNETLGYEWDQDVDNGFRPAGEIDLSSTTMSVPQVVQDYKEDLTTGTETHHLTLYRASSGALVFGAGTVQWSWGLNGNHDGDAVATSTIMQQATVNLLADMGSVQPASLMSGLVAGTDSTDTTPPTSAITSPAAGTTISNGSSVTISGTATDSGGGVVAGVEVSTDGGQSWHPVTTMSAASTSVTWSYTWSALGAGNVTIEARATDDSGNIQASPSSETVTVNCPCSLYGQNYTPSTTSSSDTDTYELGVKFTSAVSGWVTGVRFYKGTGNDGTHTGALWTASGTELASGTFSNETASGWQTLTFQNPVPITANTVYVASYYDPDGHYASDTEQFYPGMYGSTDLSPLDSPPLHAVQAGASTGNGVYNLGGSGFPTSTYDGSGYGVDVGFTNVAPGGPPPTITGTTPSSGATSVPVAASPSISFSGPVESGAGTFTITGPGGTAVSGTVSLNATNTTLTFNPSSALAAGTTYTASVSGVEGASGSLVPGTVTWQFTTSGTSSCPCVLFESDATPVNASGSDTSAVTLGAQFTTDTNGWITGVEFYKGSGNTGTHIGNLWTSSGTLLAQGTFTSETASGWQKLTFSNPVAVTAGTTYVAGYYAPNGGYAADGGYFTSAVNNSPLHAPANAGVYAYGNDQFPSNTYNATNYWVQPLYTATSPSQGSEMCPCSIWPSSASPQNPSANDPNSVELGVKFTTSESGYITGIRFYKGSSNMGTHIGSLWNSSGSLLGQVTFTNETASGWQQANFSTPIPVTAGTTYIASYFAPDGGYAADSEGLVSGNENGPLTALPSATSGGNGVYAYTSSPVLPTNVYNANNYWVDVVFSTSS